MRGHRDLSRLTRWDLALATGLAVPSITAYETGTEVPPATVLDVLADTLAVPMAELTVPAGADDSWEYWDVICAAMPPMTDDEITTVATVLNRIDARRESGTSGP